MIEGPKIIDPEIEKARELIKRELPLLHGTPA
jgi:hypothetical protein